MKKKPWQTVWWIIFLKFITGYLPFPKLMKNKTKKVKKTVSKLTAFINLHEWLFSAHYIFFWMTVTFCMHFLTLMVIIFEFFYLEIISSSNFPSFLKVFSSDRATQSLAIQVTSAFEQIVVLIKHWLNEILPCISAARLEDELRQEIKKLGGYLQLFLQVNCFADYHLQNSFIQQVFIDLLSASSPKLDL